MRESSDSVAAVLLAYSRRDLLPQVVDALRNQTRRPDEIIVIYQGSRDDIAEWLAAQADLTVIRQENQGSAGGFCRGIREAIARGHGWSWMFDDDAVPQPDALAEMVGTPYFSQADTAFMACRVVDRHGRTYMSPHPVDANRWYPTVLKDRCVEVDGACWVGILANLRTVRKAGLPIAEFFIFEEDLEFTTRLARHGKAYCPINSVLVHYQSETDTAAKDRLRATFYTRNNIARAKIEPGSVPLRTLRTVRRCAHFTWQVLVGRAPPVSLLWILRGALTFWPRIRYPD